MRIAFLQENALEESLGIASLSSILISRGHEADVFIESLEGKKFREKILNYKPRILAFSSSTGQHVWANNMARSFKDALAATVIMGGMHPTLYPERAISLDAIDIICIGEGEFPLLELADSISNNQNIDSIKNLWIKKQNLIIKNEIRNLLDPNTLPLPNREIYYKYKTLRNITTKRFIASFGCPYCCSFCQNKLLMELYKGKGSFIRQKDPLALIKEILHIKNNYPLEHIHFSDDCFPVDKAWLQAFALEYEQKVKLPFNCNIQISQLNEESSILLKKAGCYAIGIGLETGDEKVRSEILKKHIKNETIIANARLLNKTGIKLLTNNLIALPGETPAGFLKTVLLNQKIKADYTRIQILRPFYDTEIHQYCTKHDLLIEKEFQNCAELHIKTPYARKLLNLRYLFPYMVKMPFLNPIALTASNFPITIVFKYLYYMKTALQELSFFRINIFRNFIPIINILRSKRYSL